MLVAAASASGTLPAAIFNRFQAATMPNILDLSFNSFDGNLPVIATTAKFHNLNIASNQLVGAVPSSWPRMMVAAEFFDASNLFLSEELPGNAISFNPSDT